MKKFLVILLFTYGVNLSYAKQCISKRSTETGESKYTEQHSIETNISGHKLRIFTLVVNPKSSKKNCDGLKVKESVFWGMSNYVNKNGNVNGNWLTTYDDGSTMYGTFTGNSQTPQDTSQDSISVGSSIINGGTGIYSNVTGYGTQKTIFNPEKNYSSGEITLYFTK